MLCTHPLMPPITLSINTISAGAEQSLAALVTKRVYAWVEPVAKPW
jgi:hypothetical protein